MNMKPDIVDKIKGDQRKNKSCFLSAFPGYTDQRLTD